jgi:uncharacterized SAM-binding protein YcdF (DUF218 family)
MVQAIELLHRIFSDVGPPGTAEAAYLFAETEPNQESVFMAARELLERGKVRKLLISDCRPKSGYAGVAACRRAMEEYGISAEAIDEVPMEPTDILHTLLEAETVVRLTKARGYRRLIVVATPFHQQRAVITTISVALREYPSLKIYSHPGAAQSWEETVTHSQGVLTGTRAELLAAEQERIEKYTAKGDLVARQKVLEYFRARQ